jgi:hypothetical protein
MPANQSQCFVCLAGEVGRLRYERDLLRSALGAVGVDPEHGYCFGCTKAQQEVGHAPECRDARVALSVTGDAK